MASSPRLLWHAHDAPLHPTDNVEDTSKLLAVRFEHPVRIASLRIAPEGVQSVSGVGYVPAPLRNPDRSLTYPNSWRGTLWLNTSDAEPGNSLATTGLEMSAEEREVDFAVDMPEGVSVLRSTTELTVRQVTTRLIILSAPVEHLTISVYGSCEGFNADSPLPEALAGVLDAREVESWEWLSAWAGGDDGLLELIGASGPHQQAAIDAMDCLADTRPFILNRLIQHPTALPALLSMPSYPPQPLLRRLYSDPTYSLHSNIRPHLPHSHPLKKFLMLDGELQVNALWDALQLGRGILMLLTEAGAGDLLLATSSGRSRLVEMLDLAQKYATAKPDEVESGQCLRLALRILSNQTDPLVQSYLARYLPRLTAIAHASDPAVNMNLSSDLAKPVLTALATASTEIHHGTPLRTSCLALAEPYLLHIDDSDPVHRLFSPLSPHIPTPFPDTPDGRRLTRLDRALAQPHPQTSFVHTTTPAELLSILAPSLLRSLSTARIPALGIQSVEREMEVVQASAWAGKVYSEHQFRDRMGLGIKVGPAKLGVQAGGDSRPASRHVDDYAA